MAVRIPGRHESNSLTAVLVTGTSGLTLNANGPTPACRTYGVAASTMHKILVRNRLDRLNYMDRSPVNLCVVTSTTIRAR